MTTATTRAVSRIQSLSPAEVHERLQRGEIDLIDVREPVEHAGGRIPGARLVPLARFDPANFQDQNRPIVLHCQSGSRSAKAAQRMLDAGHAAAVHMQGGFLAWRAAGLPTERDAKAPISVLRQVQITAGSLVLVGSILGGLVSPWFFILSGFIGAGLVFAGLTDTCGMATLLAKMPWNRRK